MEKACEKNRLFLYGIKGDFAGILFLQNISYISLCTNKNQYEKIFKLKKKLTLNRVKPRLTAFLTLKWQSVCVRCIKRVFKTF